MWRECVDDETGASAERRGDRADVQVDSDAAATLAGATGYGRPEDIETAASTGSTNSGRDTLYVAITSEDRVLAIDLSGISDPHTSSAMGSDRVFGSEYVKAAINAPVDFESPDNLALDEAGNVYITEDPRRLGCDEDER